MSSVPLWGVALVIAVVAPWTVHAFVRIVEGRTRRRTMDAIAIARPAMPDEGGGAPDDAVRNARGPAASQAKRDRGDDGAEG